MTAPPYVEKRASRSEFVPVRGLKYHVRHWGASQLATSARPPLFMLHGWMDVGASFQFIVDALTQDRHVIAPDWRGFGLSEAPAADSYWFPDYLGDLDALIDWTLARLPGVEQIDLLGHSMGGNVAMVYAGVRPERIRRLVNLEGFGMPATQASTAPARYAQWLAELKAPPSLHPYPDVNAVAARLCKNNPLLAEDRAAWLALRWAHEDEEGRWHILGDPAHKRANPVQYQKDEVLACWQRITAPVLWAEGDRSDVDKWWGNRYPRAEFHERFACVARSEMHVLSPAGHMLHHDQPEALARLIEAFLSQTT